MRQRTELNEIVNGVDNHGPQRCSRIKMFGRWLFKFQIANRKLQTFLTASILFCILYHAYYAVYMYFIAYFTLWCIIRNLQSEVFVSEFYTWIKSSWLLSDQDQKLMTKITSEMHEMTIMHRTIRWSWDDKLIICSWPEQVYVYCLPIVLPLQYLMRQLSYCR